MAQLQERIRVEVNAREDLAKTYESSLNKGVGHLNNETRILAENPLIQEISLIVAQEILNKSKMDASMQQLMEAPPLTIIQQTSAFTANTLKKH